MRKGPQGWSSGPDTSKQIHIQNLERNLLTLGERPAANQWPPAGLWSTLTFWETGWKKKVQILKCNKTMNGRVDRIIGSHRQLQINASSERSVCCEKRGVTLTKIFTLLLLSEGPSLHSWAIILKTKETNFFFFFFQCAQMWAVVEFYHHNW